MKIFLTRNDYNEETRTGGFIYLWTIPYCRILEYTVRDCSYGVC